MFNGRNRASSKKRQSANSKEAEPQATHAVGGPLHMHLRRMWRLLASALFLLLMAGGWALAQPAPTATIEGGSEFIGSSVTLPVSFANAGTVGYGPYLDLYLPDPEGAVAFEVASYLGVPLDREVVELDGNGEGTHPFLLDDGGQPLVVEGPPGGRLVVLTLPFGSIVPAQPSLDVDLRLRISKDAEPGVGIELEIIPGFRYGADALDNPADDPPVIGSPATGEVTPEITRFVKRLVAPEGDTPVGESFTHRYELELLIAPGQTLENVTLTDELPNALVIRGGSLTLDVNGSTVALGASDSTFVVNERGSHGGSDPAPFPGANTGPYAQSEFTIRLPEAVTAPSGQPGTVLLAYDFYIPSVDANGAQAGAPGENGNQSENVGRYEASWTGNASVSGGRSLSGSDDASVNISNASSSHPPRRQRHHPTPEVGQRARQQERGGAARRGGHLLPRLPGLGRQRLRRSDHHRPAR